MRFVDPDSALHETAEFRISGTRLELQQQAVARRAPATRHCRERADWARQLIAPATDVSIFARPRIARIPLNRWRLRLRLRRHRTLFRGAHVGTIHAIRPFTRGQVRKERPRNALGPLSREWQPLLSTRAVIDERAEQGEVVREIFEHALEVALESYGARTRVAVARIAPGLQLPRHDFLNGPAVSQVGRATRAG